MIISLSLSELKKKGELGNFYLFHYFLATERFSWKVRNFPSFFLSLCFLFFFFERGASFVRCDKTHLLFCVFVTHALQRGTSWWKANMNLDFLFRCTLFIMVSPIQILWLVINDFKIWTRYWIQLFRFFKHDSMN